MIRILMVSVAFDSTNLIFNPSLSFTAAAAAAIIHCCQCHNPVVVVVSSTMKRRDVSFRSVCLSFQRTTIYSTTTTAAVQTMFASYQFHRDFHSLSVDEGGGGGRYCNILSPEEKQNFMGRFEFNRLYLKSIVNLQKSSSFFHCSCSCLSRSEFIDDTAERRKRRH